MVIIYGGIQQDGLVLSVHRRTIDTSIGKEGKRVNDANDYKTKKFVKKKEKDELQIKGNKKYKKQFDSEQSAGFGKTGMKITTQTPQHTETKSRVSNNKHCRNEKENRQCGVERYNRECRNQRN